MTTSIKNKYSRQKPLFDILRDSHQKDFNTVFTWSLTIKFPCSLLKGKTKNIICHYMQVIFTTIKSLYSRASRFEGRASNLPEGKCFKNVFVSPWKIFLLNYLALWIRWSLFNWWMSGEFCCVMWSNIIKFFFTSAFDMCLIIKLELSSLCFWITGKQRLVWFFLVLKGSGVSPECNLGSIITPAVSLIMLHRSSQRFSWPFSFHSKNFILFFWGGVILILVC